MTRITYNVHGQPQRPADWRDNALCASPEYAGQAELWFAYPSNKVATTAAKQVCAVCPVRAACLRAALKEEGGRALDKRFGIRGGFTAGERLHMYRKALASRKRAAA